MIIVKTKLKKIPDTCTKCRYSVTYSRWFGGCERFCPLYLTNGSPTLLTMTYVPALKNYTYLRPDWCPLEEKEEG